MKDDPVVISSRLNLLFYTRDWTAAMELIKNDSNDEHFAGPLTLSPAYTWWRDLRGPQATS